jgi:hypothetical protein
MNGLLLASWSVAIGPTQTTGSDYGLCKMAQDPSSPPRDASKPGGISDLRQELPALLRGLVDDMQALCELAVVVGEFRAEVLCASEPAFNDAVSRLVKQPGRNLAIRH